MRAGVRCKWHLALLFKLIHLFPFVFSCSSLTGDSSQVGKSTSFFVFATYTLTSIPRQSIGYRQSAVCEHLHPCKPTNNYPFEFCTASVHWAVRLLNRNTFLFLPFTLSFIFFTHHTYLILCSILPSIVVCTVYWMGISNSLLWKDQTLNSCFGSLINCTAL